MRPDSLDKDWNQAFLASPFWLRFELGGERWSNLRQPVPRFIQAFDRARTVSDALFAQTSALAAILAAAPRPGRVQAPPAFKALERSGFEAAKPWCEWQAQLLPDDVDGPMLHWRGIDHVDPAGRDTLLWACIAREMPIAPRAPVLAWLVDFDAGVTLHVYDDRGMDVCALQRAAIEPLYRQFDTWLLDYDRPRMAAAFR